MWLKVVLGLLSLLTITRGEIFDVTTIYDLNSDGNQEEAKGHVHTRTNALGLPVVNYQGGIISTEKYMNPNLNCDFKERDGCSWDIGKNWSSEARTFQEIKPGKKYKLSRKLTYIGFDINMKYSNQHYVNIYITNNGTTQSNNGLLLRFYGHSSVVTLYKCYNSYPGRYYSTSHFTLKNQGESFTTYCDSNLFTGNNFDFSTNYLSFNFSGGKFQLYDGLDLAIESSLFSSNDELHFNTYFGQDLNQIKPAFAIPVKSAKSPSNEMVSPLVSSEVTDQLCLTLVLHSPENFRQSVLLLLAEDFHRTQHILQTINNVKAGWNFKQFCFKIDKMMVRPFKLVLRNSMNISIARISTFNLKGEEVWPIDSVSKYSLLESGSTHTEATWTSLPTHIYKSEFETLDHITSIRTELNNTCQNGGIMTVEGCACLPGFTGTKCQSGCGSNRFGFDCGGLCSLRPRKCRDLLMCNSVTGCHCAPGYKGENCDKVCKDGEYGNDCKQTCGKCSYREYGDRLCDIYTGECQSCEAGFVLPYCNEGFVYYNSKPELTTLDYGTITVKFNPKHTAGFGSPELFQIQYRERNDYDWEVFINKDIQRNESNFGQEEYIEEKIEGLKTGHLYQVRVILMDASFNKYDGDLIQASEIVTKCDIPETYDYGIEAESYSTYISFSWLYENETENWCPVEVYEITWEEGWEWKTSETTNKFFTLDELLPNSTIKFRVKAKTSGGYAPFSEIIASTKHEVSSKVRDLQAVDILSTSVQIEWSPPWQENNLIYKIAFKCVQQPACPPGCVNATEGAFTHDTTSVTLSPLLPFAQYQVTVSPVDGPERSIFVGTKTTVPTEIPKSSGHSALRTNTSLTVFWEPVPVCTGFLLGYNYHLLKKLNTTMILDNGFTKNTNATFHELKASTEYSVRVYVVTIAGWDPDSFLDITASTSATVPEVVRNLTVYKRGRNTLGLRWAAPYSSYGTLKSFTVTCSLGKEQDSHVVQLTPCIPWPHLFCYTFEGLKANRKYNVSVSARNSEVADDGAKTSVIAMTKESPPTAPEGLKLTNSSSTSVNLEWRYPDLANGIIRSFLVSVEETERYDQENCCQIYPLLEIPVQEDRPSYNSRVSELHPASTYFVSVSAKTVGLGPPQSLVIHTKPPHLTFSTLPPVDTYDTGSLTWLPQEPLPETLKNPDIFIPLIRAYLLLIVDQNGTLHGNDSGIFNPQLNSLLQQRIAKPFFFYTEYSQESLDEAFATSSELESSWGARPSPSPFEMKNIYHFVAVQVLEYNNEFNIDLRYLSDGVKFNF